MGTKENSENVSGTFLTNRELLSDVHKKVNDINFSLHGDKNSGVKGYYQRVQELEKAEKNMSLYMAFVGSVSSALTFLGIKLFKL